MTLSNLNSLSEAGYFSLLYEMIKQRENPWLYAGTGFERIHNGGGDGNPTFGYGFNLAAFNANVVEQVILHAYGNSLTSLQTDGLDIILDWKAGASVWVDGLSRKLTNADIINMADVGLNGAPGAVGSGSQRTAVQSLALNDVQATRMLDVMIKGDLNLVHIEGPFGSWGYEDGLDYRLAEEGPLPYSTERAALLSVYYNAPSLIGPGVQNAIATDDRAQLWYEVRYNHNHYNHNGLQSRRAEEADLIGFVSQSAKNNPNDHINEYAEAMDTLFNGFDRLSRRIFTRIEERDTLDEFEEAISPELQELLDYYVLTPLGASTAPMIDYVQADSENINEDMVAKDALSEGVSDGKSAVNTVNLILGKGGNDYIVGLGAADYLYGGEGADTIYGDGGGTLISDAGHDLIDGGYGNDLLYGGPGDDHIDGGSGNDRLQGGNGGDRLLGGSGFDTLRGALGADTLNGDGGDDRIFGGAGADIVNGGAGADRIRSEAGNDTVSGGADDDRIFGSFGFDSLRGNGGNDLLDGNGGNDTLIGDAGNDTLIGNFGFDSLDGGLSHDRLEGSTGNDRVTGGGGNDTFVFAAGDGDDRFLDFVAGASTDDVIELSGFGSAFDTFTEVQAASSQSGADVMIDFGGGDSIRLFNTNLGNLHQDDFVFG